MEPHLTEEELLSLVDRSFDPNEEIRLCRHLLQCDSCLEDLRFMANDRVFPISSRLSDRERRSLIDSGMFVAKEPCPSVNAPEANAAVPIVIKPRRRGYQFAAIAAGLVAIVTAAWLWQEGARERSVDAEITSPILAAMTEFSDKYFTVLPGTEDKIETGDAMVRSSGLRHDEEVYVAMGILSQRYQDQERSRELLYWLIGGYILDGQFNLAIAYSEIALELYPDDAEIATMYGLAAYEKGDLRTAKKWLRSATASEGDTGVAALNLGIVLMEIGESDEARDVLRTVHESDPESSLGIRAVWLLNAYSE